MNATRCCCCCCYSYYGSYTFCCGCTRMLRLLDAPMWLSHLFMSEFGQSTDSLRRIMHASMEELVILFFLFYLVYLLRQLVCDAIGTNTTTQSSILWYFFLFLWVVHIWLQHMPIAQMYASHQSLFMQICTENRQFYWNNTKSTDYIHSIVIQTNKPISLEFLYFPLIFR